MSKFVSAVCAISTVLPAAAVAQSAPQGDRSYPAGAEQLEDKTLEEAGVGEIVVTATRRPERLQDVPTSITALSGDQLERAGITSTQQLTQVTPGLNFTQSSFSPQPTIRGIGTRGTTPGDESVVPVYVDGVYQPALSSTVIELNSIERIEVLKGPQGALLGRNATGGAINIITRTPTVERAMDFSISYGRFNEVVGKAYITGGSGPIAADLALLYSHDDGYIRNIATGSQTGDRRVYSMRSKIRIEPTSNFNVTFIGGHAKSSDTSSVATRALNRNTIARRFNPAVLLPTGFYETSATEYTPLQITNNTLAAVAEWSLPNISIHSVSGHQAFELVTLADTDTTPLNLATSTIPSMSKSFYQDLYLVSKQEGPFSWILGGTFFHDRSGTENVLNTSTAFPSGVKSSTKLSSTVRTSSLAAWGQIGYDITDELNITLGGRYTRDRKQFHIVNNATGATIDAQKTWSKFTPSGSILLKLAPTLNVYGKVGQAFKAGIFPSTTFSAKPAEPETVTQYEIGFKGGLTNWLRVNLAGYYTDYTNVQVSVRDPITLLSNLENAASARIYGAEADIVIEPLRRLNIRAGASLLNGKYKDYRNAQVFIPTGLGGNAAATQDAGGKKIIRTPFTTLNLGVDYAFELSGGSEIAMNANLYYSGHSYWEASNRLVQPRMTLVNAELSYLDASQHVRFAIWGTNLLNKKYPLSVLASTIADSTFPARPREAGVRMSVSFR